MLGSRGRFLVGRKMLRELLSSHSSRTACERMTKRRWEAGAEVKRGDSPYAFAAGGYSRGCRQPVQTGSRCCPLGPGSAWPAALPNAPAE